MTWRGAAHEAMSGRTDMMISSLSNAFIHVPIEMTCMGRRQVDLESELRSSVLAATGQPPRFTGDAGP